MFKLCINNNRYKNLSVGLDIYFVLVAWFYFTVEHQCRYLNSFFIVFDIFLWIIETEVSDDQRKKSEKSTKESQVKYIVNGIVGAVCFIIIVATISCCVVKMKKQSSTIDDECKLTAVLWQQTKVYWKTSTLSKYTHTKPDRLSCLS